MRVLLGLGDMELPDPVLGDHLGEGGLGLVRDEGDRELPFGLEAGHRRDVDTRHVAALEPRKLGSPSALVSSRARSGRKLKCETASPSATPS